MAFKFYLLCVHRDTVSYPTMACTVLEKFYKVDSNISCKENRVSYWVYVSRGGRQTYWMRRLTQMATVVEWPWKMGHSRKASLYSLPILQSPQWSSFSTPPHLSSKFVYGVPFQTREFLPLLVSNWKRTNLAWSFDLYLAKIFSKSTIL